MASKKKKSFAEHFDKALNEAGYERNAKAIVPVPNRDRVVVDVKVSKSAEHHAPCPSCEGEMVRGHFEQVCSSCGYRERLTT